MYVPSVFSQLEYSNWILTSEAQIDFKHNPPVITYNKTSYIGFANITSISDYSGNLLFYSRGAVIYDKNNQIISTIPNVSSYAPIATVPHPLDDKKHFYFIIRDFYSSTRIFKLYCYTLDFNKNNGLGGLGDGLYIATVPDKRRRSFTIAKHYDSVNYWALVATNSNLHAYHITEKGVVSTTSAALTLQPNEILDKIKISPDMSSLYIFATHTIYIADFNNSTGEFSNFRKVFSELDAGNNLFEFSPDGHFLYYVNSKGGLFSFFRFNTELNRDETNFTNSEELVAHTKVITPETLEDIQLAIDGKIYISKSNSYLFTIENPNEAMPVCHFNRNGLNVNRVVRELPHFFHYHASFSYQASCVANDVQFKYRGIIPVSSQWSFGDNQTSNEPNPTHTYTTTGKYTVTLKVTYSNSSTQTITKDIVVNSKPNTLKISHD